MACGRRHSRHDRIFPPGPGAALAPMAGVTNHPLRLLAREQGCSLLYSEMISAKGLLNNPGRCRALLYFTEAEKPFGYQLFGSHPATLAAAAEALEGLGADFIDLNLGCPARKILRNGEGGALMLQPDLCSAIFRAVRGAVSCPVTVKMRTGWDGRALLAPEIAARAEEAGLAAVCVHGRHVQQGYAGRADWQAIAVVRKKVRIPLIGNGDVDSPAAAEALLRQTGCDAVMVGRAARGNPWLFAAILARLAGKSAPPPPTPKEIVATALRHFRMLIVVKGETLAAREMRRHLAWYLRGLPGAAALRQDFYSTSSYDQALHLLNSFLEGLED